MTPEGRQPGSGINIFIDDDPPIAGARIKVIGIGGGGSNAVNRMIEAGLDGIEFLVANTDLQALKRSRAPISSPGQSDEGLGAGSTPDVGEKKKNPPRRIYRGSSSLEGADMVFVTTSGGGTGRARLRSSPRCRQIKSLTAPSVTTPFHFEGRADLTQSEQGLRACALVRR